MLPGTADGRILARVNYTTVGRNVGTVLLAQLVVLLASDEPDEPQGTLREVRVSDTG